MSPIQHGVLHIPWPPPHDHRQGLDGSGVQPTEDTDELGTYVMVPGMGGGRCADVRHFFKRCYLNHTTIWLRNVGGDLTHQPYIGGIQQQGIPLADR